MNIFCFLQPPQRFHAGDAFDLVSREKVLLRSGYTIWNKVVMVPLGVKSVLEKPLQLIERSGMALHYPFLAMGAGLIDPGYRGEWKAIFRVHPDLFSGDPKDILEMGEDGSLYLKEGVRVAQAILPEPFEVVSPEAWDRWEELYPSTRGAGGFGSTGVR